LIKSVISLILLFRSSAVLLLASIFLFISESSFSALFLSANVCFSFSRIALNYIEMYNNIHSQMTEDEIFSIFKERQVSFDKKQDKYDMISGLREGGTFLLNTIWDKDKVVETLATSYPMTTPVAVVQRASWPDQKIVLGTLETIEQKVKEAGINKTAQILVGDFLGNEYEKSKLYDKYFTHEYREAVKK